MKGAVSMKKITDKRYEIFFREFENLGVVIEELQNAILKQEYGKYDIRELELEKKIALKILEGMDDFQRKNDKGIRFDSIFKDGVIEIYDINEEQRIIDEAMMKFEY